MPVYADDRHAVVVTLDREFTLRRRKNPIGRHVQLRCAEPEAAEVLETWLPEVLGYLERDHVTVIVSIRQARPTAPGASQRLRGLPPMARSAPQSNDRCAETPAAPGKELTAGLKGTAEKYCNERGSARTRAHALGR